MQSFDKLEVILDQVIKIITKIQINFVNCHLFKTREIKKGS